MARVAASHRHREKAIGARQALAHQHYGGSWRKRNSWRRGVINNGGWRREKAAAASRPRAGAWRQWRLAGYESGGV
jgi:hypothetical protein